MQRYVSVLTRQFIILCLLILSPYFLTFIWIGRKSINEVNL